MVTTNVLNHITSRSLLLGWQKIESQDQMEKKYMGRKELNL